MELYVMRHGPAEDHAATDDLRELTPQGRERVRAVARELVRHQELPRLILTSPLVRAGQTAELVGEATSPGEGIKERAPLGVANGAMEVVDELLSSGKSHVMLVGHQPDLSNLVRALTRASFEMEKAMVVGITFPTKGPPCLRFVLHPTTLLFAPARPGSR